MATALIFLAAILFAELTGGIQAAWAILGVIGCVSGIYWRTAKLPILLGICGLGMTAWVARDWVTLWVSVGLIYFRRCCVSTPSRESRRRAMEGVVFWLTVCVFGYSWDWLLVLVVSCAGLAATAPIFRVKIGVKVAHGAHILGMIVVVWGLYAGFQTPRATRVAYIEHGKWAMADVPWSVEQINMRSAYAYSEFAKLVSGERISLPQLDGSFGEAWMITPTMPLSEAEISTLENWISKGGNLILVTDHTDVFGHARVANRFLDRFGISADYTAFFPAHDDGTANDGWFGNYSLRTSNTFRGRGVFPLVTARWFNEAADYSTKNFFGRLRATGEDEHARRTIAGVRAHGLGQLIVMGDSTIFSNFATYAPDSVALAALLKSAFYTASLYRVLPWLLVMLTVGSAVSSASRAIRIIAAMLMSLLMLAFGVPHVPGAINWGRDSDYMWWSGDRDLVQGMKRPSGSFSTAYTIASLSGFKPRWTESLDGMATGIWVSTRPPPKGGWRWISPDVGQLAVEADEPNFGSLYDALGAKPLRIWPPGLAGEELKAGELWTNSVMGDEWFDRGISPSRMERFSAFWAWVRSEPAPNRIVPAAQAVGPMTTWSLKLPQRDPLIIPLPLNPGLDGEFMYLGRGLTGQWTTVDGESVLLGLKPFSESWWAPEMWALRKAKNN